MKNILVLLVSCMVVSSSMAMKTYDRDARSRQNIVYGLIDAREKLVRKWTDIKRKLPHRSTMARIKEQQVRLVYSTFEFVPVDDARLAALIVEIEQKLAGFDPAELERLKEEAHDNSHAERITDLRREMDRIFELDDEACGINELWVIQNHNMDVYIAQGAQRNARTQSNENAEMVLAATNIVCEKLNEVVVGQREMRELLRALVEAQKNNNK